MGRLLDPLRRLRNRFRTDEFTDAKLRDQFRSRFNIEVGLYSYGCFDRARIDPNTRIGRYCSFSQTAVVLNRNHGMEFISTTPYLYNSRLGMVEGDGLEYEPCEIGDDVWVGHNAIITPSVHRIGRGAVIAAGAVVTKDVPAYAVVAGSPAKVLRLRFSPDVIAAIEATRWWEWDLAELERRLRESPDLVLRPAQFFGESHERRRSAERA
jgi:acetyltransferase-like isoleucine patch superfamily enzyme